ncbi:MAG: hypothetical protein JST54_00135 [Deltaproteobacteria bacterium]|nr:hypothetical protein [Deltaproteobacteria bacterium]
MVDAPTASCVELPQIAINAQQASSFAEQVKPVLDAYCACRPNVREIVDGAASNAICIQSICEPAATWTCADAGSFSGAVDMPFNTCSDGVAYSFIDGSPQYNLFVFGVAALTDPVFALSAKWNGPPTMLLSPDGGYLGMIIPDGGSRTLGLDDFSEASSVVTLVNGGTFAMEKNASSRRGDLKLRLAFEANAAVPSESVDARLDPVDAGPDAGPIFVHLAI